MASENGSANGNGSMNGGGISPAVHIPKPGVKQNVRQDIIKDDHFVIPHVSTYAGQYNVINKSYYIYFDEALRNSQSNTLAFRRDGLTQEFIRSRQFPVICSSHHIDVDDPDHPDQKSISETVHKIFSAVPRLKSLMMVLMEATFYGRYGSQIQLGPKRVAGNTWNSIVRHIPINGDKFRYKWDGTPGISIYQGAQEKDSVVGDSNDFLRRFSDDIQQTMLGPALFLKKQFLRDRFIIHNFEPFDTDYLFEIDESQSIFGLGLRSRLYWTWNLRTELLSWMIDALQRVGANGMIFGFSQSSNPQAMAEVLNSLRMLSKDNLAVFPMPPNNNTSLKDVIQRIEPSAVGYDVLFNLITHLEGIMRRAFLGQDLSSESKPTGIGGGAAKLHSDVRQDIRAYDADNLAETLTEQLISVIVRYNDWNYEGKVYKGWDLPFDMRLKIDTDTEDAQERMAAAQALFNMGVELDKDDVREAGGFSPPKKKSTALINHQLEQTKQANEAGQPQFNELNKHMKGLTGEANKQKQMGMMGGQKSRFAKPKESYCLFGRLYVSKSGWGLLSVPNNLVYGLFDAMNEPGIDLPPASDHGKLKLNAHISVFSKEEIEKIGSDNLNERGHSFAYNIGRIKEVKPAGWSEMEKVWFVEVDSPELEDLRASYGLSRLPKKGKHQFHISAAVRKSSKGKNVKTRLAKSKYPDDCGHDSKGFSKENTCAKGSKSKSSKPSSSPSKASDQRPVSSTTTTSEERQKRRESAKIELHKQFLSNISVAAAKTNPKLHQGTANTKIWIYEIWNEFKKLDQFTSFDDFKSKLIEANQNREISLVRHDMPHALSKEEKAISDLSKTDVPGTQAMMHMLVLPKSRFAYNRDSDRPDSSDNYEEGEQDFPSSDTTLSAYEVGEVLARQYLNVDKDFDPGEMVDRWVESSEFHFIENLPLWPVSLFKYVKPSDHSHSDGPIIIDYDKTDDPRLYGSFGARKRFRVIDGKHRWWDAIREGKTHLNAFVGDTIKDELEEWIESFGPKREAFVDALNYFYDHGGDDEQLIHTGEVCGLTFSQIDKIIDYKEKGLLFDPDLGYFVKESQRVGT